LKITIFIPSLGSGGAERVAVVLANQWVKQGYSVTFLLAKHSKAFYPISSEIKIETLNFDYSAKGVEKLTEYIGRINKLRKYFTKSDCDYFISFNRESNMRAGLASFFASPKNLIFCEHNNYFSMKSKLKRFFRNAIYSLTNSKITVLTQEDISNYPKHLKEKLLVMPNPLGLEPELAANKMKSTSDVKFLAVGRLTEQKGFDRLVLIAKELLKAKESGWTIDICGDGVDKSLLNKMIIENNLSNHVKLCGNIENISQKYQESDVFLMTSRWEGLPMVLGEALAYSLPVVAYDCVTGPSVFISHTNNGFLIEEGDDKLFVDYLLSILNNPNQLVSLSDNARISSEKYKVVNITAIWSEKIFNNNQ